jgi:formamidase
VTDLEIAIDGSRPLADEPGTGHNRWHPDIEPILRCRPGDVVTMGTRDALDGQITPASTAADVAAVDSGLVHPLTGPIFVKGAEPGDLLIVDVLDVVPAPFAFTCRIPGLGFLRDQFREPGLVRWTAAEGVASSADLPGVRIPGAPFMGTIGVAPSQKLLEEISARERNLAERGGEVLLPDAAGAVPADPAIAGAGLRTIPPREIAGNVDIKQLVAGTRIWIPVWTEGALFSAGDAHFAQGAGEVCGQAIEVAATLRVRLDLLPGEARARNIRDVRFEGRREAPAGGRPYFATTGVCVQSSGRGESEDLTLAARNALLRMIEHITATYGYSPEQGYTLCSVAVDLEVSQVVNAPSFLVSAFLPLDIFE